MNNHQTILEDLFNQTIEFESPLDINSADFVEWFRVWREEAMLQLAPPIIRRLARSLKRTQQDPKSARSATFLIRRHP